MSIQQIRQDAFLNTDEIILVLDMPGKTQRIENDENSESEVYEIIKKAKLNGDYYDLTGSEPLLSIIVLRNGSVVGTCFLSKTLVRNRFHFQDTKQKKTYNKKSETFMSTRKNV